MMKIGRVGFREPHYPEARTVRREHRATRVFQNARSQPAVPASRPHISSLQERFRLFSRFDPALQFRCYALLCRDLVIHQGIDKILRDLKSPEEFQTFNALNPNEQLERYESVCRQEIIHEGIERFLRNPAALLKEVSFKGRTMSIVGHLNFLNKFNLLDEGLSSCPIIAEIFKDLANTSFINPLIYSHVGLEPRSCPTINAAILSHEDANLVREEEQYIQRIFNDWEQECLQKHRNGEDFQEFLIIDYYDLSYSSEHPKGSVRPQTKNLFHAIYVGLEKQGDVVTLSFFDPWGCDALDPGRREGSVAFNALLKKWAADRGYTYLSLPELDIQMQFPGAKWEKGGVCGAFTGLQIYFSTMRIPPEKIARLMRDLGHEGREKFVRHYLKFLIDPTPENRASFQTLVRHLLV